MAHEVKRVDYTTKDYHGYREDMVDLIPKKLPEWTDRSPNDPGIVILELLAYALDKESYYNDRVANEVFLSTATQRKSVIEHCKKIGYELAWQTSAKHYQVFEIVPQPEPVIIPRGTLLGTKAGGGEDAVIFETLTDLVIPSGMTGTEKDEHGNYIYQVEIEHGQTITDEYLGDVMNADPHPTFQFTYSPILKDSIEIYVEDSTGKRLWEKVSDFIGSDQEAEHYTAEMDEYDRVAIQFGNGASGKLPKAPSSIYANYKVGGGIEGNVGANTIVDVYDSVTGFVQTFNPFGPHLVGADKESLDDAKWKGPASLKRLDRYVTLDDYEKGIMLDVKGIAKAKAINVNGDVDLYILPKDGTVPTAEMRMEILRIIEEKKVLFTKVFVKDPVYLDFDVKVNILIHDHFDRTSIKYMAENILREMYDIDNVTFGDDVQIANLYHELIAIHGVKNAILLNPTQDIETTKVTIPRIRNVEVLINGF